MGEIDQISILEDIQKSRQQYELSFATTFNCYLPFYETIVFRQLKNVGSRVNTLLMDAGQCSAVFQDQNSRPILAGRDYTLIPIKVDSGVFHPKLLFLIGKERCKLYVGSHNMTLSGFGRNRELTASFEITRDVESTNLAVFQNAWRYLRAWTVSQNAQILSSFDLAEDIGHWALLPSENSTVSDQNIFFATDFTGASLWKQVREFLHHEMIRKITLVSPFFDKNLDFLKQLRDEFLPEEFIVGIQPETVKIPPHAYDLTPEIKFVDAKNLRGGSGYLHAKAIVFETVDDDELILIGSANATRSAWLDNNEYRNIEAAVLLKKTNSKSIAKKLGLSNLATASVLTNEAWEIVQANKSEEAEVETHECARLLVAIETDDGFTINVPDLEITDNLIAEVFDVNGESIFLEEIESVGASQYIVSIPDPLIKQKAVSIKFEANLTFVAHCHHTSEILSSFHGGKNKDIYAAFDDLDAALPMLEGVLRIVHSVIFDSSDEDWETRSEASVNSPAVAHYVAQNNESFEERPQESFSVSLADVDTERRKSFVNYDDLSELLTALNRRLSVGVEAGGRLSPAPLLLSEEELIDSDEEETEPKEKELDLSAIAKSCRRRTKTLMKLMLAQLEAATDGSERRAYYAIRRLAAVLGFLHWIKGLEYKNLDSLKGETFIDENAHWNFFLDVCALVCLSRFNLLSRAKSAITKFYQKNNSTDEVSAVLGLLIWTAWNDGFDVKMLERIASSLHTNEQLDGWTTDDITHAIARFIAVAPYFLEDDQAQEKAKEAIKSSESHLYSDEIDVDWLKRQTNWMEKIVNSLDLGLDIPILSRTPEIGDLVRYNPRNSKPQIFVVQSISGNSVRVINLNEKEVIKAYSKDFVPVLNFNL